jgi:hypothetical protein
MSVVAALDSLDGSVLNGLGCCERSGCGRCGRRQVLLLFLLLALPLIVAFDDTQLVHEEVAICRVVWCLVEAGCSNWQSCPGLLHCWPGCLRQQHVLRGVHSDMRHASGFMNLV